MSELEFDFYSALESQASTEECKTKLKNITSLKDKKRFTKNVVLIEEHDITAKVLRLIKFKIDRCVFDQLDDGVKINYAKFGTLLAEAKAITGDKAE